MAQLFHQCVRCASTLSFPVNSSLTLMSFPVNSSLTLMSFPVNSSLTRTGWCHLCLAQLQHNYASSCSAAASSVVAAHPQHILMARTELELLWHVLVPSSLTRFGLCSGRLRNCAGHKSAASVLTTRYEMQVPSTWTDLMSK
jgi:hypothetical protein